LIVFVLLEHFRILLANYIVILFYITSNKKMYHHAFPRTIFQCQGENSPVFHLQFPFVLLAATVTKKRRVRQGISANVRIFLDQKNSDLLSYKFTSVTVLRCKKFIIVTFEI
jgi:hypothetical protein